MMEKSAYLGAVNVVAELGKMSQGKETRIPAAVVAAMAIGNMRAAQKAARKNDDRAELERMFRLPDSR